MEHIDLKYKDEPPSQTVERIRSLLEKLGLDVQEHWNDSGIENCQSLFLFSPINPAFRSNGKGVSKELARASAYGEFIERLQCGLNFYKYQSITRDPEMLLHTFAPDARYMTTQELEETGDWMDHVIQSYPGLTRKKLAKHCKVYACTDEDRILTIPFYSLFEDKYVYLPAGYVEYMYTANGCCVGNTKEEAWIHAFSEIFERRSNIHTILNANAMPVIPDEVLRKFPTVWKICQTIRQESDCDIAFFDFSLGSNYPVVASRLIDKKTHGYIVNVGADPILEIALERTLTELFQGRQLHTLRPSHNSILETVKNIPPFHNILNQLQTGDGAFPANFFCEELTCCQDCSHFPDNSGKSNAELLQDVLNLCRSLNRPVYIRNYSFLGFPCYKIVIPGFSETKGLSFQDIVPEYALGDTAAKVLKNPESSVDGDLKILLLYYQKIRHLRSSHSNFSRLAGLPLSQELNLPLLMLTLSYANYRLGYHNEAITYLNHYIQSAPNEEDAQYFSCVSLYLQLTYANTPEEKIRLILKKFYKSSYTDALFSRLDQKCSPFSGYLMRCDHTSCNTCRYQTSCTYKNAKALIAKLAAVYKDFTDGQNKEQFIC